MDVECFFFLPFGHEFQGEGPTRIGPKTEIARAQIPERGPNPPQATAYAKCKSVPAELPPATPFAMASSSLFAAARRLISLGRRRGLLPVPPSRAIASSSRSNSAEEGTLPARPPSLQYTLWPLGKPGTLLVPEIEMWATRSGN